MLKRYLPFSIVFICLLALPVFAQKNLTATDDEVAVLDTSMGKIVIEFYPNAAPNHVKNFKKLSQQGFYNGTKFHRVIPGFMIQGGDPNSKDEDRSNDGTGNAGYTLNAEFTSISHKRGIVSMARSPMGPNTASSQFFIVVADAPSLDRNYSVFGNVIQGMEVADKIVSVKRDAKDNPLSPVILKSVTIQKRSALK